MASDRPSDVAFRFEDKIVPGRAGEPVGVALFAHGIRLLGRSPKFHRPRGLFCGNGHCGSCLLRIDGIPNVRACQAPVSENTRCERQNAFPDAEVDLLAAADWFFPRGMDHHRMMTGTRLGNELFVKLVRQVGGMGKLPDEVAPPAEPIADAAVDVLVVGGGPAGLAAATALAKQKPDARILLLDDQAAPGGSLRAEPDGDQRVAELVESLTRAGPGVEVSLRSSVLGHYPEDEPPARSPAGATPAAAAPPGRSRSPGELLPGVVLARRPAGLLRIKARRLLYATGAYEQNLVFPGNDRPGVLAARAVGRLAFCFGLGPARKVVFATGSTSPLELVGRLAAGLQARGVKVEIHDVRRLPRLNLGRDVLAVAARPAPASELLRQHGCPVVFEASKGGFVPHTDSTGRCAERIFAAGDVCGYRGPQAALAMGTEVGRAVAEGL